MGFSIKEGFNALKHKIEKHPVRYIGGALAAVLLSSCVTIIAKDLANSNPVAAAPQPTPRVTFVNTPIPTGVPTLVPTILRPTEVPPTPIPTKPAVVIAATQEISGSIGGAEGVSNIKDAVIPGDIADKIASVNSAVLRAGFGYGGINEKAEALTVNDPKAIEGMKPFVLKIKTTGAQYFVITPNGEVAQGRFFNITSLGKPETIIPANDLLPYETFLKNIAPKAEPTKIADKVGLDIARKFIKESSGSPSITERSTPFIGTDLIVDTWVVDTNIGSFSMEEKLKNPNDNKIALDTARAIIPEIQGIKKVVVILLNAGDFSLDSFTRLFPNSQDVSINPKSANERKVIIKEGTSETLIHIMNAPYLKIDPYKYYANGLYEAYNTALALKYSSSLSAEQRAVLAGGAVNYDIYRKVLNTH